MSDLYSFFNDHFVPLSEAGMPVNDLGVQRGYGIFDFLRVSQNLPLFMEDHLDRFYHSAAEMRLPVAYAKEALKKIIEELLRMNSLPDSGVRILLSGGISADGYQISHPNLVIIQQPIIPPADTISKKGYKLVTYPHQRQMPQVKTTDYLMAVWLQPWVKEKGADDVLYHAAGIVSECPRSNFFIVTHENKVVTPGRNILRGITAKQILTIAREQNMAIEERDISLAEIRMAKEAFISSSTKRIIPVASVDDIVFTSDTIAAQLYNFFLDHEKKALASAY